MKKCPALRGVILVIYNQEMIYDELRKQCWLWVKRLLPSFEWFWRSDLEGPDFAGTDGSTSENVLDTLVLGVGDTGGTILELESSFTRVDFASSVFTVDIFDIGDLSAVETFSLGGTSTTWVEGRSEI
jgi:hypothetical protein